MPAAAAAAPSVLLRGLLLLLPSSMQLLRRLLLLLPTPMLRPTPRLAVAQVYATPASSDAAARKYAPSCHRALLRATLARTSASSFSAVACGSGSSSIAANDAAAVFCASTAYT